MEKRQKEHNEQMQKISAEFRHEMEVLKGEANQFNIKMAELNVILKNDANEIKRLMKENEKLQISY